MDIILSINSLYDLYGKNGKKHAELIFNSVNTSLIRLVAKQVSLDPNGNRKEVINRIITYYFGENNT